MDFYKALLGIVSVLVVGLLILAYVRGPSSDMPQTVEVNGIHTLNVVPDNLVISLGIETIDDSAEKAQKTNADILQKVKDKLKVAGLDEKDLITVSFNVYPNYDYRDGTSILRGYTASHNLELKVADIEGAGVYLDVVVSSGINRVYNLRYEISEQKRNDLKSEALAKASEDARNKAEAIANGLDAKIVRVVKISDQSFDYGPIFYRGGAEVAVSDAKIAVTEFTPGDVEVTARVAATFEVR